MTTEQIKALLPHPQPGDQEVWVQATKKDGEESYCTSQKRWTPKEYNCGQVWRRRVMLEDGFEVAPEDHIANRETDFILFNSGELKKVNGVHGKRFSDYTPRAEFRCFIRPIAAPVVKESETPRTDAAEMELIRLGGCDEKRVMTAFDFARTLERELAGAKKELGKALSVCFSIHHVTGADDVRPELVKVCEVVEKLTAMTRERDAAKKESELFQEEERFERSLKEELQTKVSDMTKELESLRTELSAALENNRIQDRELVALRVGVKKEAEKDWTTYVETENGPQVSKRQFMVIYKAAKGEKA